MYYSPKFEKAALDILTAKKNVRLIELDLKHVPQGGFDIKNIYGGLLVQQKDEKIISVKDLVCKSKKKPTKIQLDAALFGWKVIKNVKSNAIVVVKGCRIIGIGCGQTSRVESVRSALSQAGQEAKGSILISDAFLPKTDNVTLAAKAGVKVIVQTGGSIADEEVIACADKAGIVMIFTGVRHFKH